VNKGKRESINLSCFHGFDQQQPEQVDGAAVRVAAVGAVDGAAVRFLGWSSDRPAGRSLG
jgi:hypothetical protein